MSPPSPLALGVKEKGGVFFLYGDDAFRKEDAARSLVEWHLLEEGTREFNLDFLRGSEVDLETLASVLATPPMMAEWRVVLLREVEALASSPRAREALLDIVRSPPPGLALVLMASIPRGSTAKFYKELRRMARSIEFPEVGPADVPAWIVDWAGTRHGRKITDEAARALAAGIGTNLGVLAQEVEKLVSLVEEGQTIEIGDVRAAGTQIPSEDRWVWMDRIGRKEYSDALRGLGVLLGQGESGVGLTIGLTTHMIRLALARSGGPAALESALPHRQRFLAPRLAQQAGRWTLEDLENAILGLRRVDRLLKSSSLSDQHILEGWILELMVKDGDLS